METISLLIARLLMGGVFFMAGLSKISAYAGTQAYMEALSVPGILLPGVIALEILAGLAIIVGWKTRWAAFSLAGFTLIAALIFHNNLADQVQSIMFMKNLVITGGMIILGWHGAGALSLDHRSQGTSASMSHA